MCTASWRQTDTELLLWFNRDEQRTRPDALPPREHAGTTEHTRFIAPVDPQGGGTWIFVNRAGIMGFIMNNYDADRRPEPSPVSRGQLMLSLADSRSMDEVQQTLCTETESTLYAPCFIGAGTLGTSPRLWQWDGHSLSSMAQDPLPMHTTSSFRSDEVVSYRRNRFTRLVSDPSRPTENELTSFHTEHDPSCPAHSVWMERPDAWTVSLTRVHLTPERAVMFYRPRKGKTKSISLD